MAERNDHSASFMRGQAIIQAQAQDRLFSIPYRPQFNQITGRVTASILLQQIAYWWEVQGRKPFYKFRAKCSADRYHEGDSWTEELGFSSDEFDTALRTIGTKITKGTSKSAALASREVDHMVIYWTDSNHLTWYQLNEEAFYPLVDRLYVRESVDELAKPKHLRPASHEPVDKSGKPSSLSSEITPETTTDTHLAATAAAQQVSEASSEAATSDKRDPEARNPGRKSGRQQRRTAFSDTTLEQKEFTYHMVDYFVEVAQVPLPAVANGGEIAEATNRWYVPLSQLSAAVGWDEAKMKGLIRESIKQMDSDGLTISTPQSILHNARGLIGEQVRKRNASAASPPPRTVDPFTHQVMED